MEIIPYSCVLWVLSIENSHLVLENICIIYDLKTIIKYTQLLKKKIRKKLVMFKHFFTQLLFLIYKITNFTNFANF